MLCSPMRPPENEAQFKRRALRDAIICIGWLKLTSVICYVVLYFLVRTYSAGHMSEVLQIMVLAAIPFQILHGILLFLGALEGRIWALEISQWLCLLIASYNTMLGAMGCIFFMRNGHITIHFLMSVMFALLALSLCTVLCHDILVIYSYKILLLQERRGEMQMLPITSTGTEASDKIY